MLEVPEVTVTKYQFGPKDRVMVRVTFRNKRKRHLRSLKMINLRCYLRLPPAFTDTLF